MKLRYHVKLWLCRIASCRVVLFSVVLLFDSRFTLTRLYSATI